MRNLRIAVAASIALHAVAIVCAGARAVTSRPIDAAVLAPVEVTVVEPLPPRAAQVEPLEVALIEDPVPALPPPAAPPVPPRSPPPQGDHRPPAITAPGATSAAAETAASPAAGPAIERRPGSSVMSMRRGDAPRLTLPTGRWDDLDHPPSGTSPEQQIKTGMLDESGGGTHRSEQGVFVAKVNPDGTVKLTDRPNLRVRLALPTPRDLGRALGSWYDSKKGAFGEGGDDAMAKQIQVTSGARTDPGDPVTTRNNDRAPTATVPVIGGSFDVNDWLMRRHGQDPYASRKLALLDATRDERAQIGSKHRAAQLKQSTQIMQKNLEALWAATPDPRARKQALFELWDDCAETGDAALVEAGQAARRLVIGAIRARFPRGSPDELTAEDLAAFARVKQSKAAFTPYE